MKQGNRPESRKKAQKRLYNGLITTRRKTEKNTKKGEKLLFWTHRQTATKKGKNEKAITEYGLFVLCFIGCLELTGQWTADRGRFAFACVACFGFCLTDRKSKK